MGKSEIGLLNLEEFQTDGIDTEIHFRGEGGKVSGFMSNSFYYNADELNNIEVQIANGIAG